MINKGVGGLGLLGWVLFALGRRLVRGRKIPISLSDYGSGRKRIAESTVHVACRGWPEWSVFCPFGVCDLVAVC